MQTFLPYQDFRMTVECLDLQRLGKQRVENLQVLMALTGLSNGWRRHPTVLQWSGNLKYLLHYHFEVCSEWKMRGYEDTCFDKFCTIYNHIPDHNSSVDILEVSLGRSVPPWWLGKEVYHKSHQSNLIRKNPVFYGPKFPELTGELPYQWPQANCTFRAKHAGARYYE